MWFAGARMAYGVLGIIVWGQATGGTERHCHFYISRCVEKGAAYSLAALKHLVSHYLSVIETATVNIQQRFVNSKQTSFKSCLFFTFKIMLRPIRLV